MIMYDNPFEYETAKKLSAEKIYDLYIEDFNYSRFIRSKRNIFLVGARGTGKTMTLLYNSLPVQVLKAKKNKEKPDLSLICIHVPCNTTLMHKKDYELLKNFQLEVITEHFLVVSIMYEIVDTLNQVPDLLDGVDIKPLIEEIEFSFDTKFPKKDNFFTGLKLFIQKEGKKAEQKLNRLEADFVYPEALSFSSGVLPLVTCIKNIEKLSNTHFALMLDDAHDLNNFQIKAVNSWVAYRDNTQFSFKIAIAKVSKTTRLTRSGGEILEGHDYTQIDMEQPYQNKNSDFGRLARRIIEKRLKKIKIDKKPEEFFPVNKNFESDLKQCEEKIKNEAIEKYGEDDKKKIGDHVYKYARAKYFRNRALGKSNKPPYSGFDIIVHISTGVIRNLLDPCYWMYDAEFSSLHTNNTSPIVSSIPPRIQKEVIIKRSKEKWEWIENNLSTSIDNCTEDDGRYIYQLFDQVAILFRNRLIHHESEPRAVTFTISDTKFEHYSALIKLLHKASKAQILYTYKSSAKDSGRNETYYVPHRILWPARNLDPHGQHARVSIKSRDLWEAAINNKKIPTGIKEDEKNDKY